MARLNPRPSTVNESRSNTSSLSPQRNSDQENHDPDTRRRRSKGKGKGRAMDSRSDRSLPTPQSDHHDPARGQKRRHTETVLEEGDEEEVKFTRYYDPHQNTDQRRDVKRRSRALERQFQENRDEYLRAHNGEGLLHTIDAANNVFRSIKQTEDAAIDSRLMVNVSDVAFKRSARMVLGDTRTGVDVELFLSKCISYMRNGGPSEDTDRSTQTRRGRTHAQNGVLDEDEDDSIEEALDWEVLGQHACFPFNARPAAPSFLLGPLSVEKKQRAATQRRARSQRDNLEREARPDQLSKEDLTQSDENQLTAICTRINRNLRAHCKEAERALQRSGLRPEDMESERAKQLLQKHRLTVTGGPSLFEFVINPNSFGQTVENLFYVSFLIKEGAVGIEPDSDGLPTIVGTQARDVQAQRREDANKHQAILSLDYSTWQDLVRAFRIQEPMIPHRNDEQPTQVGSRGWYG